MRKKILLLTLVALLCGCVNLHVHFPESSGKPAGPAQSGTAK